MPTVKNLVSDPVANPVAAPQPAAGEIAKTTPTGGSIAVPSFITQQPALPAGLADVQDSGVAYVGICTNRSKSYAQQIAAGVKDGELYTKTQNGFVRTHPLRCFFLCGELFKTKMEPTGSVSAATRDMKRSDAHKAAGLEEHVLAVLLVEINGGLVPAQGDFRRTAAPGAIAALKALEQAADPSFATISPAHAVAAQFQAVAGRIVVELSTVKGIGGGSGLPYYKTAANIVPASAEMMKLFAEAITDEPTVAAINAVKASFDARVASFEKLCK